MTGAGTPANWHCRCPVLDAAAELLQTPGQRRPLAASSTTVRRFHSRPQDKPFSPIGVADYGALGLPRLRTV